MAVAVVCDNVLKTFGETRAVDGVSLNIQPGELFFLLGPSGCGKTTLLRCIAGFYEAEQGTIRIGERDITRLPPHLRDTGMVFQSYALWPHMTVAENVAFGLEMRRVSKAETARRVDEALALVRMTDRARHKPNQLSGGQQQRVALARALVIRPQCLLLDEPLSNLDAKLRLEMRSEIRRICKDSGLTAIYVTHDQKEALSIADRLAVLDGGRVQQVGTPQEVYRHPVSRFVAGFIGETNLLPGVVTVHADGALRVDTAVGEMTCAAAGTAPAPGSRVTLSIRPEVIRLGKAPDGAPNTLSGVVHDTVYLGEVAQHQLNVTAPGTGESTPVWKAFDLNPRIIARDRSETVPLWIAPEDVAVLRE